jgi:hypothetical protein
MYKDVCVCVYFYFIFNFFHILLIVKFGKIRLWMNVTFATLQNCIVSPKKKIHCHLWVCIPLHPSPFNLLLLFSACPFDVLLSFVSMHSNENGDFNL